jgi:hypothetical protein
MWKLANINTKRLLSVKRIDEWRGGWLRTPKTIVNQDYFHSILKFKRCIPVDIFFMQI